MRPRRSARTSSRTPPSRSRGGRAPRHALRSPRGRLGPSTAGGRARDRRGEVVRLEEEPRVAVVEELGEPEDVRRTHGEPEAHRVEHRRAAATRRPSRRRARRRPVPGLASAVTGSSRTRSASPARSTNSRDRRASTACRGPRRGRATRRRAALGDGANASVSSVWPLRGSIVPMASSTRPSSSSPSRRRASAREVPPRSGRALRCRRRRGRRASARARGPVQRARRLGLEDDRARTRERALGVATARPVDRVPGMVERPDERRGPALVHRPDHGKARAARRGRRQRRRGTCSRAPRCSRRRPSHAASSSSRPS